MRFQCFNRISFRREYDGTANRQLISAANISVRFELDRIDRFRVRWGLGSGLGLGL